MAEVTIDPQNKNPEELLNQGVRAYTTREYATAVQALSQASQLLVEKHGESDDSLGDVYLYYGKALLELYREEAQPLGDAVTKKLDDASESDDDVDTAEDGETNEENPEEANTANGEVEIEAAVEGANGEASGSGSSDAKVDDKIEGESTEEKEEAEPSDLQVAWEVLELARCIYEKRGESGKSKLAETLVVLGEVSLESENFESAVDDIKRGLEVMKSIPSRDDRILAETHYKLGVALSTNSQMEEAIENFTASLELLKDRIKTLEETDKASGEVEINQMKGLIPEIEEKIADMKSFKEEVRLTGCKCLTVLKELVKCSLHD